MAKNRRAKLLPILRIADNKLRQDVDDALLFIVYLIDASIKVSEKRHKEEFYRVIILYIASVIEAICLYIIETKNITFTKIECKHIQQLPQLPDVTVTSGKLVIAIQKEKNVQMKDMPFKESIDLLNTNKVISDELSKKLHLLRETRNTHHLYRRRVSSLTIKDITKAASCLKQVFNQIT